MVGKRFIEKIEKAAKFLATPTAQAARGYLDAPLETALLVLAHFSDGKPHDYEELSIATGLHENTVRQVVRSLERGGYPLQFTYAEVQDASTGRKSITVHLKRPQRKSRAS